MSKFEVGDRIAIYEELERWKATIIKINELGHLYVLYLFEGEEVRDYFHPKQCRKIKKKERRRVWVDKIDYSANEISTHRPIRFDNPFDSINWVEFVEVKKRDDRA